jgi:hypothetical protein
MAGDIFTIATLHTILRNPAYKGPLMFNRRTKSKWHRFIGGANGRSTERHDEGFEKRMVTARVTTAERAPARALPWGSAPVPAVWVRAGD